MIKINGKTAQDIAGCIRAMVQGGELKPGEVLPSVRDLAEELGVNRNTVSSAYQRLAKAGFAIPQGRLGTIISEPLKAGEQEGISSGTALIDLADGNPNPLWLPEPSKLGGALPRSYLYGDETILPELRQIGEQWLSPDCPDGYQLELTNGAIDAIERLAAAQLVAGDIVALETPCFLGTINALRLSGMTTVGVQVDEHGMLPGSLHAALESGVKAVFVTPRAQNPTGGSLTKTRASELKEILESYPTVLIVVDDHFCLLEETPYFSIIPPNSTCWALIRSVSKGLGPDMRVAFVASDAATADRLRARLAPGMTWVSRILQALVVEGLTSEYGKEQIRLARDGYSRRRRELHSELAARNINIPSPAGGFNVWIPVAFNAKDVAFELAKKGWLVRLGTAFDVSGHSDALRVTISHLLDGQASKFAEDLKKCLNAVSI